MTVFPHVLQDFALGSIAFEAQVGIKDWGLCKGSLLDRCWQHFGAAAFKFLGMSALKFENYCDSVTVTMEAQ